MNTTTNNFIFKSEKDGNIKENMQYYKIYTKTKTVVSASRGNRTDKSVCGRKRFHNGLKTDNYGVKQKHKSVTVRFVLSTARPGDYTPTPELSTACLTNVFFSFDISYENEVNIDLLSRCRIASSFSHVNILYLI